MNSDQEAFRLRGCGNKPSTNQNKLIGSQQSCSKLNAYDWLKDINFIEGQKYFDIVEVRFKNNRKEFFRAENNQIYRTGDIVAVEASSGHDIGIVSLSGEIVRLQIQKKNAQQNKEAYPKIYRLAKNTDIEKWIQAVSLENITMIETRKIVSELGLQMKINDVDYQGDSTKAVFYYTAEGRVDFRELIRRLANKFSVRIEMKQIGVRQESSRLGGIGSCGRELCCGSWLTNFKSVSTIAARTQQLSMNPQKLAGQCGKLKCCLNFEFDNYKEELKKFPQTTTLLQTKSGDAFFQKMDILSGTMYYSYKENPSVFIALKSEDVKEIQMMNKKGISPESLDEYTNVKVEESHYDNVIGQDDLTRFDNVEKGNPRQKPKNKIQKRYNTDQKDKIQNKEEVNKTQKSETIVEEKNIKVNPKKNRFKQNNNPRNKPAVDTNK